MTGFWTTRRQLVRELAFAATGWGYVSSAFFLQSLPLAGAVLCPFRLMTGFPCPLCGTTRAWNAALHGDLDLAFTYNSFAPWLLPVWIGVAVYFSMKGGIGLVSRPRAQPS